MPHVVVKLHAGRTGPQKARIAEAVCQAIIAPTGHGADAVSVAIEDVQPDAWAAAVYRPDILGKPDTLYKKPGYTLP